MPGVLMENVHVPDGGLLSHAACHGCSVGIGLLNIYMSRQVLCVVYAIRANGLNFFFLKPPLRGGHGDHAIKAELCVQV